MLDRPWIVVVKAEKGWTVCNGFKKGNEADDCADVLKRKQKYEEVIVAFNPFYKVP